LLFFIRIMASQQNTDIKVLSGIICNMHQYMADMWTKMWKTNSEELKSRAMAWRKEPTIHRVDKPSRLDRAHKLGYKAKQGIIVIRTKVGRGGMRKQRPVSGRRPKHLGVVRIKQAESMKLVAQRRVNEKYPNLEVLGSYFLYKDGKNIWYEIILADPSHPSIARDVEFKKRLRAFAK
jgi:large subunit ribosomal protein L15e